MRASKALKNKQNKISTWQKENYLSCLKSYIYLYALKFIPEVEVTNYKYSRYCN